jgi:hypothetical protein
MEHSIRRSEYTPRLLISKLCLRFWAWNIVNKIFPTSDCTGCNPSNVQQLLKEIRSTAIIHSSVVPENTISGESMFNKTIFDIIIIITTPGRLLHMLQEIAQLSMKKICSLLSL